MLLRPDGRDLRIIGGALGTVATGLAVVMALPTLLAVILREWHAATALVTGVAIAASVGQLAAWRLPHRDQLTWAHGTVVVALAWLLGPLLVAVPFYLSGHAQTFLDAWFEAMSGFTTSGLSVLQDLDHLALSIGFLRHLTHFVGGQGIVIVVLSLFAARGGLGTLYVAEGREERILPGVVHTARFILLVAGVYLVIGTTMLTAALWGAGIPGWRGLWHAVNLFFAGFDTGGFAPTHLSIGYYHSGLVELVLVVLMVAGTLSFGLHHRLWSGDRRELLRSSEVRVLAATVTACLALGIYGLARSGAVDGALGLLRTGGFTVLSAHSGTGFAVVPGEVLLRDWGALAPAGIVLAMALGGMAGSTAGGIKAARVMVTVKALVREVRRLLLPDAALLVTTFHSGRRQILRVPTMHAAGVLLLLYVLTYLAGAFVGLLYGRWAVTETLFESVSAAANVGLSVGIVGPGMPVGLQVTYLLQMWLGRLEFLAAFALVGYVVALIRGRT